MIHSLPGLFAICLWWFSTCERPWPGCGSKSVSPVFRCQLIQIMLGLLDTHLYIVALCNRTNNIANIAGPVTTEHTVVHCSTSLCLATGQSVCPSDQTSHFYKQSPHLILIMIQKKHNIACQLHKMLPVPEQTCSCAIHTFVLQSWFFLTPVLHQSLLELGPGRRWGTKVSCYLHIKDCYDIPASTLTSSLDSGDTLWMSLPGAAYLA